MTFVEKTKMFSKEWFMDYSLVLLGTFVMASGFVFFIDPHGIVPGGAYGVAIVVNKLTQGMFPNGLWGFAAETFNQYKDGIPIGFASWIINIPLLFLGIKVLGPRFGMKTVVGFTICSYFIDQLTHWWGLEPLVTDVLLSCIFGGVLIGVGLALIFKARATTAGSDIIAMILAKYTNIQLGQLLIYVDSVIVLLGLLAFNDWQIPLYSWVVIFITGKAIDMTMDGANYNKALLIISDKHEEIRRKILHDFERGGTYFHGEGMWSGEKKQIIYTVVNRREVAILKDFISKIDENAFITVMNTSEILGEGFNPLKK